MAVRTTDQPATYAFGHALEQQIIQLNIQDESLNGRTITVNGREMVNFGHCSYLGLELHPALRAGSMDATTRYGTVYSSSRAYTSLNLYKEAEQLLEQIFGAPTLLANSTSLGHLGVLPTLIDSRDALIMDQQVHASVQTAVACLKGSNATLHVEKIKHSHLEMLEHRIQKLASSHQKIWYLIDGVYSMFGDVAPVRDLLRLLDHYENLHLYVDDAHGMSWKGLHGSGFFQSLCPYHPRVVMATSLGKGFASGGAAFVFPEEAMKHRAQLLGGTFVFSGPLSPAQLGACVASAQLHLSDEIYHLQNTLRDRMAHFAKAARANRLPLVAAPETPICFVAIGQTEATCHLAKRLQERGLYVNMSAYPVVPPGKAGLRITITNHQTIQDMYDLARAIREELDRAAVAKPIGEQAPVQELALA
jgi:7-keto-8-aminopelargonate synthetase-like enzyme